MEDNEHIDKLMFLSIVINGQSFGKSIDYHETCQRILQISWIVADENGNELKKCGYIIKPTDFEIPEKCVKDLKMTKEKAMEEGSYFKDVINEFFKDLSGCCAIVGHNVSLDLFILSQELARNGIVSYIKKLPTYCTMLSSVDYCQLPIKDDEHDYERYSFKYPYRGYKYPKLEDLYLKLFYKSFDNSFDANSSAQAIFECFFKLIRIDRITYLPSRRTYGDIVKFFNNLNQS